MRRVALLLLGAALFPAFASIADDLAVADQSFRSRDFRKAILSYQMIVARHPQLAEAHYGLSRAYLAHGQLDQAETAAAEALIVMPESATPHIALADVHFRCARFGPAEKEYKAAVQIDPKAARAWFGLARVFQCAALRKSAASYIQLAHDLAPEDPDILHVWASFQPPAAKLVALQKYARLVQYDGSEDAAFAHSQIALYRALKGNRPFTLESPYVPADIRLEPAEIDGEAVRGWKVAVTFNGSAPRKLLLDTGASGISLGRKGASGLKLKRVSTVHLNGFGDETPYHATMSITDRVDIGPLRFRNCPITVSEAKSIAYADGIIGSDVFEQFLITVDSPSRVLALRPYSGLTQVPVDLEDRAPPSKLTRYSQFFRLGHVLLLPARGGTATPGLFIIDSGSSRDLLSTWFAQMVTKLRGKNKLQLNGLSGRVQDVYTASNVSLEFAGMRKAPTDVAAIDFTPLSSATQTEVSGLLGFPLLSMFKMTINYKDGLVSFELGANAF